MYETELECDIIPYTVYASSMGIYMVESIVCGTKLELEVITNIVIVLPRKVNMYSSVCLY